MKHKYMVIVEPHTLELHVAKLVELIPGTVIAPNNEAGINMTVFDTAEAAIEEAVHKLPLTVKAVDTVTQRTLEEIADRRAHFRRLEEHLLAQLAEARRIHEATEQRAYAFIARLQPYKTTPDQLRKLPVVDYTDRAKRDQIAKEQSHG